MPSKSAVIHQKKRKKEWLQDCVYVYVCARMRVCVADVLCSLSDSQQYPAADTLSGPAGWLSDRCVYAYWCVYVYQCVHVCVCVCLWLGFLVCEHKGACFASSKSMSPRGNVEPTTKNKRDWEQKGKPWANPSPISAASSFTNFANFSV